MAKLCVDFRRSSTSSSTGGVPTVSSGSGSSLAADIQRLVALGQKGMSALNSGSQGPSNASLAQENRKRSYERSRETSSSFHHRPQVSRFIEASSVVSVTNRATQFFGGFTSHLFLESLGYVCLAQKRIWRRQVIFPLGLSILYN